MNAMKAFSLLFALLFISSGLLAQEPSKPSTGGTERKESQPERGMKDQKMMERCQEMLAQRQKMMSEMKAMDARLDQKVAAMNAATESEKVDAMAAVINELVWQRQRMREKMMAVHAHMMAHMMEHTEAKEHRMSMSDCPLMKEMMKDMKSDSDKPAEGMTSRTRSH